MHLPGRQRNDELSMSFCSHQLAGPYLFQGRNKLAEGRNACDAGHDVSRLISLAP